MAKEKPVDPERAARKAEKKAKKEAKLAETNGVHKSKKEKKAKAEAVDVDAENMRTTTSLLNTIEAEKPGSVVVHDDDQKIEVKVKPLLGALVAFANPLADEKTAKKVFRTVKKSNRHGAIKRGVKEVVKAIRKSPIPAPSSTGTPPYICVLAADISPMDIISHIPVLCEDHGIPYIFVTSRAELGAASCTKRPTSVVLIGQDVVKKKKSKDGDAEKEKEKPEEDWEMVYEECLKVVRKAGSGVRI